MRVKEPDKSRWKFGRYRGRFGLRSPSFFRLALLARFILDSTYNCDVSVNFHWALLRESFAQTTNTPLQALYENATRENDFSLKSIR